MGELFIPTARNSERFQHHQPDYGRAAKYLPNSLELDRAESKQQRATKGRALRAVIQLRQRIDVAVSGTPYQCGCQRLLDQFIGVREAHNLDVLFVRDRTLAGLIAGAMAFQSITNEACARLIELRENAYTMRAKELGQ